MMIPSKPLSRRTMLRGAAGVGHGDAVPGGDAPAPRLRADGGGAALHRVLLSVRHRPAEVEPGGRAAERDHRVGVPAGSEGLRGRGDLAGGAGAAVRRHRGDRHRSLRRVRRHPPAVDGAVGAQGRRRTDYIPSSPTLDQYLADQLQGTAPYRNLALSATTSTDLGQGNISFRTGGQVSSVTRNPRDLFNTLFPAGMTGTGGATAEERVRRRQKSVLDFVLEDANRLNAKLGAGDKQRLGQYLQAVSEVEKQIITIDADAHDVHGARAARDGRQLALEVEAVHRPGGAGDGLRQDAHRDAAVQRQLGRELHRLRARHRPGGARGPGATTSSRTSWTTPIARPTSTACRAPTRSASPTRAW